MVTYFEIAHVIDGVLGDEQSNIIVCWKDYDHNQTPTEEEFAKAVKESKGMFPKHSYELLDTWADEQSDISEYQRQTQKQMYCFNVDNNNRLYQIYDGEWMSVIKCDYPFIAKYR